ncbi:hypothetical protein [Rhizobium leguminosarum]
MRRCTSSTKSSPYEAAGGGIVRDLFNEESGTFLTDQPLLTRLAMEVLEGAAEPLKTEGWGWVETSLDASVAYGGVFGRIYPQARGLTDDEQAELAALGESFDEVQAQVEGYDEGDPAIEADEMRLADIEGRIAAIQSSTKTYDPRKQALAGCMVYVDQFGAVQVGRGYVKAEDREALEQVRREEAGEDDEGAGEAAVSTGGWVFCRTGGRTDRHPLRCHARRACQPSCGGVGRVALSAGGPHLPQRLHEL